VFVCVVCQEVKRGRPEVSMIDTNTPGTGPLADPRPAATEVTPARGRKCMPNGPRPFDKKFGLSDWEDLEALAQTVRDIARVRFMEDHPEAASV
jgi:hypothetical protein